VNETSYNSLPYEHFPIQKMHADHIKTVAHLHGLNAGKKSVLELGCGSGAHLIPMAAARPDGEFVGVDLSNTHITTANRIVTDLGLRNIHFECADLATLDAGRTFDQITAHGVYSWVEKPLQDRILSLI
jgi:cyclopropane fatty-acyl-phospholipid synthase-like methyltransferase